MIVKLFGLIFLFAAVVSALGQHPIKALIITGGHDYDTARFFEMFESFEGLEYEESIQPKANLLIEDGRAEAYDILVFYDMYDSIRKPEASLL